MLPEIRVSRESFLLETLYHVHMDNELIELRRTVEKLAETNALRASRIQYRDHQLLEAATAGATWSRLQEVTGLSPRGLALALARARKHRDVH